MADLDPPDLPPAPPAPSPAPPAPVPAPRRTRLHTPLWAYALVFAVGFAIVYFSTREIAEE